MKRAFALLLLFWVWPVRSALPPSGQAEKLHGKITVVAPGKVEIVFTIQPHMTILELDGAAPVEVGDWVQFDVGPKNTVELNGKVLKIAAVRWIP